jgi:SAM-dependent methyltransferase
MDKVERQREHFERISRTYHESRGHANHLLLKRLMWDAFFHGKDFLRRPGMRVLEPMCGFVEGKSVVERHLTDRFAYSGFDYSQPLIDLVKESQPDLDVVKANVLEFESDAGAKADLIILIGGLHHVYEHAGEALRRVSSALRPGGHFVSFEPTHNLSAVRWIREAIYARNDIFDEESEQGFALAELDGLFRIAGFELVDQMYPGLLSYVLYYNPDAFAWLNRGGAWLVRTAFALDRPFLRGPIGRRLSFATLSLWQKREGPEMSAA